MQRILFVQRYIARHGGHITARDYFLHSMAHPELDPYVYFTPDSNTSNDVWAGIPRARFVTDLRLEDYDLLFVGGSDWKYLPRRLRPLKVINVVLHVKHATVRGRRRFLQRPAYRIANAQEVLDAISPIAVGPVEIIHEAIDFDLFRNDLPKAPGSVLIYGEKNPSLADALSGALRKDGVDVTSFNRSKPHAEFARMMSIAEIFVALPNPTEGGYRLPLEAMASGCAVVCSDAVGTREYVNAETCLMPDYGDFDGYLASIRRLLDDDELRHALVARGGEMAQRFSFERQRELYHNFVDRHVLPRSPRRLARRGA